MKQIESYKGFETTILAIKMNARMIYITIITCLFFHALTFFLILFLWLDTFDFHIIFTLIKGWIFSFFSPDKAVLFKLYDKAYYLNSTSVHQYIIYSVLPNVPLKHKFIVSVFSSFLSYLIVPFLFYSFWKKSKLHSTKEHIRGPRIISSNEFIKQIKNLRCYLPFGEGIELPVEHEAKHLLLTGSPGSGKTVLLSRIIDAVIKRTNNCVIYDFKGDFLSKFYREEKDHIFNPLDVRCLKWNVFNEMATNYDIEAFSASLIPPATGSDSNFWNDAARDVLTGILIYLHQNNKKTNKDIWETVTLDLKEISITLKNTKGAERGYAFIQDASSKQALSIIAVLMQYAKSFEYLQFIDGDFSIREWIKEPQNNIYIPNHANTKDVLRPILSLFVDLLGRQLLSLNDDYNRRVFFFLDEFGTLQHLSTIVNLLTLGRSKGASVWIGIQDLGQLENIYGKDLRSTIINACGNSVFLRVADPVTSQYLSDKIGKAVFLVPQESYSMGVLDNRDGLSLSKSEKIENLVMASELMSLNDLEGYISFVGTEVAKIKFPYASYESINDALVENPEVTNIPQREYIPGSESDSTTNCLNTIIREHINKKVKSLPEVKVKKQAPKKAGIFKIIYDAGASFFKILIGSSVTENTDESNPKVANEENKSEEIKNASDPEVKDEVVSNVSEEKNKSEKISDAFEIQIYGEVDSKDTEEEGKSEEVKRQVSKKAGIFKIIYDAGASFFKILIGSSVTENKDESNPKVTQEENNPEEVKDASEAEIIDEVDSKATEEENKLEVSKDAPIIQCHLGYETIEHHVEIDLPGFPVIENKDSSENFKEASETEIKNEVYSKVTEGDNKPEEVLETDNTEDIKNFIYM